MRLDGILYVDPVKVSLQSVMPGVTDISRYHENPVSLAMDHFQRGSQSQRTRHPTVFTDMCHHSIALLLLRPPMLFYADALHALCLSCSQICMLFLNTAKPLRHQRVHLCLSFLSSNMGIRRWSCRLCNFHPSFLLGVLGCLVCSSLDLLASIPSSPGITCALQSPGSVNGVPHSVSALRLAGSGSFRVALVSSFSDFSLPAHERCPCQVTDVALNVPLSNSLHTPGADLHPLLSWAVAPQAAGMERQRSSRQQPQREQQQHRDERHGARLAPRARRAMENLEHA
mmetsp:Transcript_60174/g.105431  ORF Transcript_60174/g.105431 Transcript_60174/m.105431 type:complete len:285 (+) Transcript_60174:1732-2586(+)